MMASLGNEETHVHAVSLDAQDTLHHTRNEFLIPSKAQLKAKSISESRVTLYHMMPPIPPFTYVETPWGFNLGLPRFGYSLLKGVRKEFGSQYFSTWASQGVYGHFKPLAGSPLPVWLDADARASESIAPIVGALTSEVAVMQTLTANLHLLMSAFYTPDINGRHKIIIETQAFPSDHVCVLSLLPIILEVRSAKIKDLTEVTAYNCLGLKVGAIISKTINSLQFAAESQILHHGLSPATSLVTIRPPSDAHSILSTSHILSIISEHGPHTALLLLPGIQYYTGQFLDIPAITTAAHDAGIFVIWDLAHAVGNVPLKLHDWNVDAAVWCSYKYLNAGPGSAGGLFVHETNSKVTLEGGEKKFVNRLSGWWGSDKTSRFVMDNKFVPIPGAAGFQLSNPSIYDLTSINASLEVFAMAGGIEPLREKSLKLTAYLESQLTKMEAYSNKTFEIITPAEPKCRGAQLSLRLEPGLLDIVMKELEERGVVVDERRPDVIRVAPAPLYNTFEDCWNFVAAFKEALEVGIKAKDGEVIASGTDKLKITS